MSALVIIAGLDASERDKSVLLNGRGIFAAGHDGLRDVVRDLLIFILAVTSRNINCNFVIRLFATGEHVICINTRDIARYHL